MTIFLIGKFLSFIYCCSIPTRRVGDGMRWGEGGGRREGRMRRGGEFVGVGGECGGGLGGIPCCSIYIFIVFTLFPSGLFVYVQMVICVCVCVFVVFVFFPFSDFFFLGLFQCGFILWMHITIYVL